MKSLVRLCLVASSLVFVAGCATRRDEAPVNAFAAPPGTVILPLGQVSMSGVGITPPYASLQASLREEAARRFHLPVEEIVVGPVDVGSEEQLTPQAEYQNVGTASVALPTPHRGEIRWTATAEVRRKLVHQE